MLAGVAVVLLLACFLLANVVRSGYGISNRGDGPTCRRGICVELTLAEPIRYGEAVAVTITVRTEADVPGLGVFLQTDDPEALVEENGQWVRRGPSQSDLIWQNRGGWRLDTKANQPIQITSAVRLPREGYLQLSAFAVVIPWGPDVMDSVNVYVTREGGVANPTPAPYTGTPFPAEKSTGGSPTTTPPPLRDKPTPWNRVLPRPLAADVLSRCGWKSGAAALAPWDDLKVWVDVPDQVPLNVPVTIVFGLEATKRDEATTQVRLGLCPADANTRVDGEREWQVEARAGAVVTRAVKVTFAQVGEVELLAGVYDSATGRVAGGGQRTRVNAGASVIQSQGFGGWVSVAQETVQVGNGIIDHHGDPDRLAAVSAACLQA